MATVGARGDKMGGAKKANPTPKYGDGTGLGLAFDYRVFFTNGVCSAYLDALPSQAASAKDEKTGENLSRQVLSAAAVYATVIYYIYPNRPLFKKAIDSDKELSENFRKAKWWIDMNGFDRLADRFAGTVAAAFERPKVV
ncbi:MAG: hypothetical protein WC717_05705 [Candidatus Micrarchaeia archaeon]|jgi:hypothetical protein